MRVLLDESVPRQLAPLLRGHEVTTVQRLGWAGTRNGELLRRASQEFQVLVTGDQGFQFQQNLAGVNLGVVIIAARDNRVETVVGLAERVLEAVNLVQPGQIVRIAGSAHAAGHPRLFVGGGLSPAAGRALSDARAASQRAAGRCMVGSRRA